MYNINGIIKPSRMKLSMLTLKTWCEMHVVKGASVTNFFYKIGTLNFYTESIALYCSLLKSSKNLD